jgi:hypothetical protein
MLRILILMLITCTITNAQSGFIAGFTVGGLGNETGDAVAVDPYGNFYIAGTYNNTVDFDPTSAISNLSSFSGNKDIYLAKYNASGTLLWASRMGGNSNCAVFSLVADSNYVLLGGSFSGTCDFDPSTNTANKTSLGGMDGFIAKYTSMGAYTYAHAFASNQTDEVKSIAIDTADNIYFTGIVGATADMNPGAAVNSITNTSGYWNAYFAKLDANGNYIFAKHINGKSNAYDIALDKHDRIYIVGEFTQTVDFNPSASTNNLSASGGASGGSGFVARYDNNGNYNWAYRNGGTTTLASFQSIDVDAACNIYIAGFFNNTIDLDFSMATSNFTSSFGGGFLLKCDSNTTYEWANLIAGNVQFNPAFEVKAAGSKVYMTGHFNGTNVDFDGTSNTQYLSSINRAAYIAAYNLDGTYAFAQKINDVTSIGSGLDYKNGIIYWIGNFIDSAAIGLNIGNTSALSKGSNDVFVGAYSVGSGPLSINTKPTLICKNNKLYLVWDDLQNTKSFTIDAIENGNGRTVEFIKTSDDNSIQIINGNANYYLFTTTKFNDKTNYYSLLNPCKGNVLDFKINETQVNISWNDTINYSASIFNITGQKVYAFKPGEKNTYLNLAAGVYFLEVSNTYNKQVVKFIMP